MSYQLGFLWLAELLMFLALGCFLRAFALRKIDLAKHKFWGKSGSYLVFVGLIAVEVLSRGLQWEFPIRSQTVLYWHIAVATAALILLLLLFVTGVFAIRKIHVRLYVLFLPLYTATLILSLFAFRLW